MTEKDDKDQGLVPNLRFPEFRDAKEWKLRELSDLLTEPKEKNRQLEYGPEHVLSVSGQHGCVNQIEFMGRSYAGASVKEYNVVATGDIVYTKSPLKACPNGIIKANKGATGIVSVLYAVYRPTDAATSDFIDYYFSSDHKLNAYLQPLVKKGPKNSILVNNSDVLKGRIGAPDVAEQQKIAECLSSLDALIDVETDKLAALRDHKTGLMQQLFPADGETTPRLRFPEFRNAGDWKEEPIGSACHLYQPETLSTSDLVPSGQFPVYGANGIIGRLDRYNHEESEIAVTCRGATCGEVLRTLPKAWINGNAMVVRPRSADLSREFLLQFLKYDGLQSVVSGSAQPQITRAGLSPLLIKYPKELEQSRIDGCLSSIDGLIVSSSERLNELKAHKSALMQQLFPSPAEAAA